MVRIKEMLLTANNQTVEFFNFDYSKHKKMGISLSGGSDSALLFYLMAKYLQDVELIPWSAYESSPDPLEERPLTIEAAEKIVDWMRVEFPDANIGPHEKYAYDRSCKETLKEAEKINVPGFKYYGMSNKGIVKILLLRKDTQRMWDEGIIDYHVNGITSNPPLDIIKEWPYYEERRTKDQEVFEVANWPAKLCSRRIYYKPFVKVDKKWIAGMYNQEGLMNTLFPITESCTGFARETNWWTEPCKQCFWCREKHWAFGCYDWGVK